MQRQDVSKIYKQNQVNAASPKDLVVMLYEGCIKFLRRAELALEDNKLDLVNENLIKAQNIIRELRMTLNMNVEGDISEQLAALYDYFLQSLYEANTTKDAEKIVYVRENMAELLDSWKTI